MSLSLSIAIQEGLLDNS